MKKIEIILVSKAFNGLLNKDGEAVLGDGFIRKSIFKRDMVNPEGSLRTLEINSLCKDIIGIEPTLSKFQTNKNTETYEVNVNERLSFIVLVDK